MTLYFCSSMTYFGREFLTDMCLKHSCLLVYYRNNSILGQKEGLIIGNTCKLKDKLIQWKYNFVEIEWSYES